MKLELILPHLKCRFEKRPVRLAFLHGSQATGCTHSESDIDVAVLLDSALAVEERFKERVALIGELSKVFQTDRVDLTLLNEASPLLAYEVLRNGILLYSRNEEDRIEFQVQTMRTYEDTTMLRRILAEGMEERIKSGSFGVPQWSRTKHQGSGSCR